MIDVLLLFVCCVVASKEENESWLRARADVLLPTIFPRSHAPFIYQPPESQHLYMAWFHGNGEGFLKNFAPFFFIVVCLGTSRTAIVVSRRSIKGGAWGKPIVASVEDGRSAQNPVLFQLPGQRRRLYLMHTSQRAGSLGVMQKTSRVMLLYSDNNALTWTSSGTVFPEGIGAFTRGPIVWSNQDPQTVLLPLYYTPEGEFSGKGQHSAVLRSIDGFNWVEKVCEKNEFFIVDQ